MAEMLLRHRASDKFDVYSAGTHPESVDIRATEALRQFGLDVKQLRSKSTDEFADQAFDYVITLCDKANNECRSYSGAERQLAWDFPDPKSRSCSNPFSTTLNELNNRLSMFLLVEDKLVGNSDAAEVDEINDRSAELEPISFYKTLTDDIRLKALMLTHYHGELCVCELMEALEETSQPKVSRNLAVLKKAKIITDRKHGQWVFYRINSALPLWAKSVIALTTENNIALIQQALVRLVKMKNRPSRVGFCN